MEGRNETPCPYCKRDMRDSEGKVFGDAGAPQHDVDGWYWPCPHCHKRVAFRDISIPDKGRDWKLIR